MMKKILIGFIMVIVSLSVYIYTGIAFLNAEERKYVEELIEEDLYSEAYKVSGSIFIEEPLFESEKEGITLSVYKSVGMFEFVDEDDNEYYKMYHSADFVLYNLSGYKDLEIEYYVDDVLFTEYTNKNDELNDDHNILSVSVKNEDLFNNVINKIVLVDEDIEFEFDLVNYLPTESQVETWNEFFIRYDFVSSGGFEESVDGDYDSVYDEVEELYEMLQETIEDSEYVSYDYDQYEIMERTGFIVKTVSVIVVLVLLNAVVFFFIFLKKPNNKMPIVKLEEK